MNEVKWYRKKELYGLAAILAGVLKGFTTPNTVAYQIGELIQYSLGVLFPLGVADGYKNGTLPQGVISLIDSVKLKNRGINE